MKQWATQKYDNMAFNMMVVGDAWWYHSPIPMVDQHYTNVNTIAINLQEIICKW